MSVYNKILQFILIMCFLNSNLFHVNAQVMQDDTLAVACKMNDSQLSDGEFLKYKAYYNAGFIWIGVGETHFKVEATQLNGKDVYHSFANAFNYRKTAWIYEVKDTYQTYLDQYTLRPVRFKRDVHEGKYEMDYQYDFDCENDKVYIDHMTKQQKVRRSDEWVDISACTYDIMSAYHYARFLDYSGLEVGETLPFELFLDGEIYPIQVKYLGKETIKTKIGKFRCIKFAPELVEGDIFEDGDELVVYASDDENKIPIYLESKLSFGKVKVYLQEFENLKHPLSSKK